MIRLYIDHDSWSKNLDLPQDFQLFLGTCSSDTSLSFTTQSTTFLSNFFQYFSRYFRKMATYQDVVLQLLFILICKSYGYILRTRCMSSGDFSVIVKNSGLHMNEVLLMKHDISTKQCKLKCVLTNDCKSFASNEREMKCQMYKKSDQDISDNVTLTSMLGWTYHTTFYNITEVSSAMAFHKNPLRTSTLA